jgi:PleD family two-component response regulator
VAGRIGEEEEFETPFEVGRREIPVTASIGVAVGSDGPRELLRSADLAMYRAKEGGKNRYEVYDPGTPVRGRARA